MIKVCPNNCLAIKKVKKDEGGFRVIKNVKMRKNSVVKFKEIDWGFCDNKISFKISRISLKYRAIESQNKQH